MASNVIVRSTCPTCPGKPEDCPYQIKHFGNDGGNAVLCGAGGRMEFYKYALFSGSLFVCGAGCSEVKKRTTKDAVLAQIVEPEIDSGLGNVKSR